jgi:hypothetical protein
LTERTKFYTVQFIGTAEGDEMESKKMNALIVENWNLKHPVAL